LTQARGGKEKGARATQENRAAWGKKEKKGEKTAKSLIKEGDVQNTIRVCANAGWGGKKKKKKKKKEQKAPKKRNGPSTEKRQMGQGRYFGTKETGDASGKE